MQRDDWTFSYLGSELLTAAKQKKVMHDQRVEWWTDKKREVMAKIQADGIDITESMVEQYGKTSNAIFGPKIVIKTEYQQDLSECFLKIREHTDKSKEYLAWVEMLEAANKHEPFELRLDYDDYQFFFGT